MDGFAREFQTGAEAFDRKVSITCDHPAIHPVLQEDQNARAAILRLFEREAEEIYSDGAHLWVYRDGDAMPDEHDVAQLEKLRAALAAVPAANLDLLHDRFFWRALLVESIAWSLAIYGVAALAEFRVRAGSLYFDQAPLVGIGLLTTLVLFSGLVGLAWLLLRGTSRAHRVFRESLFVLGIGVPLSPFVVASDVNIAADQSSPTVVTAVVRSTHTTVTRSRRGGSRTHYYVDLKSTDSATLSVPKEVEVSSAIYGNARPGSRLEIVMRNGALGVPWVKEIRTAK